MTKIKLCGLSRPEDIETANELRPDYIGFVFAEKSKRFITPAAAKSLAEMLTPDIIKVGVFVREDQDKIASLIGDGIIDLAQLHGDEDEDYVRSLQKNIPGRVIKAFRILSEDDVEDANLSAADFVLLDGPKAGSGIKFDWELLKGIKRDFFLAGGLDPLNVEKAVRKVRPFAVDVSSGIESGGLKDPEKMKQFVVNVRKCDK